MLDYNFSKIFTLEEANNSLPLVGRIVTDILSVGAEIRNSLRDSGEKPTIVENYDPRTFTKEQNQINHLMNELTEIGCFYKDWNFTLGLIDFPAVINNETVFLCWRSNESKILYYHKIESGYKGRVSIPIKYQNIISEKS